MDTCESGAQNEEQARAQCVHRTQLAESFYRMCASPMHVAESKSANVCTILQGQRAHTSMEKLPPSARLPPKPAHL